MPGIHGRSGDSITPREKKMYEQEYIHGIKLFQRALQGYAKSDNFFQKAEFKEVMDQALNVLNETARQLKAKPLVEQNEKISQDYAQFTDQPANSSTIDKLNQDLESAKKSMR